MIQGHLNIYHRFKRGETYAQMDREMAIRFGCILGRWGSPGGAPAGAAERAAGSGAIRAAGRRPRPQPHCEPALPCTTAKPHTQHGIPPLTKVHSEEISKLFF